MVSAGKLAVLGTAGGTRIEGSRAQGIKGSRVGGREGGRVGDALEQDASWRNLGKD